MEILENVIKNKSFKNVYLFFGQEKYLKDLYEKKFTDAIVSESTKMMNFDILEGKTIEISKIEEISDTLPFMNQYRLLIIKNSGLFFEGRKNDTQKLIDYLPNIPKSTIILFLEENVDKRLKIFKEVKKIGEICEFEALSEIKLEQWIQNFLESNLKTMDTKTTLFFIRNVGDSLEIISNELEKLVNFTTSKNITINDINQVCTKSIESKVFDLINAMFNQESSIAIEIYRNLINNKTSAFLILSMIYRQFKILFQVKYLLAKNQPIPNIAKSLELREFIVRDAFNILQKNKKITIKLLLQAMNECLEIDNKIKTGYLQEQLAIEILIIKYSNI